ncbi:MAG: cell division protein SepF [Synergistaceae bacterium]|nr:cell division protein SepF [Synergistaceae bacterium]
MRKLLQLFGFYGDEYEDNEDEYSDYEEEPQHRGTKKSKMGKRDELRARPVSPKLVFCKGVPSEDIKLRLRDVLLEGAMVLLDLQGLDEERIEEGRSFLHFMGGVAFAHKGLMERIGPSLFVITPHEGMLQWWPGEE